MPSAVTTLLPTPNASDGTGGSGHSGRDGGLNLRTAVPALLPTPDATRGRKTTRTSVLLPGVVEQLLPTPTSADGERSSLAYERGNPTLAGALLPTPVASDAAGGPKRVRNGRTEADHGPQLRDLAPLLLPTPTAVHSSSGANPAWGHGVTLTDAARLIGGPTQLPSGDGSEP